MPKLSPVQEETVRVLKQRGHLMYSPWEKTMKALERKGVVCVQPHPDNSRHAVRWVLVEAAQ